MVAIPGFSQGRLYSYESLPTLTHNYFWVGDADGNPIPVLYQGSTNAFSYLITNSADLPYLPNATSLGALANGLLKSSASGGIATVSIAVPGTDYLTPSRNLESISLLPATSGSLMVGNGLGYSEVLLGSPGQVLMSNGLVPVWTDLPSADFVGVTSVGLDSTNGTLSISGSPITSSGTITANVLDNTSIQKINVYTEAVPIIPPTPPVDLLNAVTTGANSDVLVIAQDDHGYLTGTQIAILDLENNVGGISPDTLKLFSYRIFNVTTNSYSISLTGESTPLIPSPITTTSGSSVLTINTLTNTTQDDDGIILVGLLDPVGGIKTSQLNTRFTVTDSVDVNTLTVTLPTVAIPNALETTTSSTIVKVTQTAHGYSVGQGVAIAQADSVGGLDPTDLNGNRIVASVINANSYTFNASNPATSNDSGGGADTTVTLYATSNATGGGSLGRMQFYASSTEISAGGLLTLQVTRDAPPVLVGTRNTLNFIGTDTVAVTATDQGDGIDLEFDSLTQVFKGGESVGAQPVLNFIEGSGVTITALSNPDTDSIDLTFAASGGGGSGTVTSVAANSPNGTISISGSPITTSGTLGFAVINGTSTQNINVRNNGSPVGTRTTLNFIPGTNTTYTLTDSPLTNAVNYRLDAVSTITNPVTVAIPDSLSTTTGLNIVTVSHSSHGMIAGQAIVLSGAVDTGGILAANINGARIVSTIPDADTYTFVAGQLASSTVSGGGGSSVVVDYVKQIGSQPKINMVAGDNMNVAAANNGVTSSVDVEFTAKTGVALEGTAIGSQKQVNLIPGTSVDIQAVDNSGDERVDVTVSLKLTQTSTSPGPSTLWINTEGGGQLVYTNPAGTDFVVAGT